MVSGAAGARIDPLEGFFFFFTYLNHHCFADHPPEEEEDERPRRGRRGLLYACPLSELLHRDRPLTKKSMRPFQIPASKGAIAQS
jgi:hypothetical protein